MIIIEKPIIKEIDNKSRLICNVNIDNNINEIYLEVDKEYGKYLCNERCDAFLIVMFYYAMKYNHNIICKGMVSEDLYYQITEYLIPLFIKTSHSRLYNTKIKCKTTNNIENEGAVGASLTCGVDSFNTVLTNINNKLKSRRITHFTIMSIADSYKSNGAYDEINKKLHNKALKVAKELNIPLIDIHSNMRTLFPIPPMHTLIRLFGIYALQKLFGVYYFSSGYPIWTFNMEDSSLIDSARYDLLMCKELSTRNLVVYSEGSQKDRLEKVKYISKYEIVKKNLHVCTREAYNCSICSKCVRTILALDSINKLEEFSEVFDIDYYFNHQDYYFSEAIRGYNEGDIFIYDFIDKLQKKYKKNEILKNIKKSNSICDRCYRKSDYNVYKKLINKRKYIGISGGSSSGKSTVVKYFDKTINNSKVISVDKYMIKYLDVYKKDIIDILKIKDDGRHWCNYIYNNYDDVKKWINIIKPDIEKCITKEINKSCADIIIVDSFMLPLLDIFDKCDYKIIVKSKMSKKLPRAKLRITEENRIHLFDDKAIKNRLKYTAFEEYDDKYNYLIYNDDTIDKLKIECDDVIKNIFKL